MFSIYIDFITSAWAILLLVGMSTLVVKKGTLEAWLSMLAVLLYLVAQSGWTTAYFSGNLYGAAISNYIWFAFNSVVLALITLLMVKR